MTRASSGFDLALGAQGYRLHSAGNFWVREHEEAFKYSDGDEVEERIASAISQSRDVGTFSTELRQHQTDWPSLYHLSPIRTNLLRPFDGLLNGARVLEIGAGCGVLSRYMGEQGAELLALEGSRRRAAITASRCRGLPNVTVLNERFDAFEIKQQFDVITLIGVLEYSRLFTNGDDPVQETLQRVRSLLADDGVLIIAIENQLGLKYFSGMKEDHLGRPMAGIQDQYDDDTVVTFGRQELETRIREAGFSDCEFALPLPDYKLPQSIVFPAGQKAPYSAISASLAGQATRSDPQFTYSPVFSLGPAFKVLGRNGLLAELSNSFLVLARKSSDSSTFERIAPDTLISHYSSARHPAYTKRSQFLLEDGTVTVKRSRLCPDAVPPEHSLLRQSLQDERLIDGTNWADRLEELLANPKWTLDDVTEWAITWRAALAGILPGSPDPEDLRIDTPIPGELVDAVARNLIVDADGNGRFFDLEWTFRAPVTFGYLTFRTVKLSLGSLTGISAPDDLRLLRVSKLLELLFRRLGMVLTPPDIQTYLSLEGAWRDEATGDLGAPLEYDSYLADVMATIPDLVPLLSQDAFQKDIEIDRLSASLRQAIEETARKNLEIQRLSDEARKLQEATEQYHQLQTISRAKFDHLSDCLKEAKCFESIAASQADEIAMIKGSLSWRITAPLRSVNAQVRRVRQGWRRRAVKVAEQAYRRLPLGISTKMALKSVIFRAAGPLLRNTGAYQRWQVDMRLRKPRHPHRSGMYPGSDDMALVTQPAHALWSANGVREWADYGAIRERIDSVLQEHGRSNHRAIAMLDYSGQDLLKVAEGIRLPVPPANPDVTILVPVYNHLQTTLECLASLSAAMQGSRATAEIIVANDASTDETAAVLATISHLRMVNQPENLGFLRNCNSTAQGARGRHLVLLNNDVQVTPGWLDAMLACLQSDPSIGAVGPQIVYPNGALQEAGTVLRRDGTAEMIGLNQSPDLPRFSYTRDVDYCSGACLLLRTADFHRLNGFDEAFAPAYCEDSDLCMRLRAEGKRIVYCAEARVVHHLSKTSNDLDNDYKLACIARNLQTFTNKWQESLDRMDDVRVISFYLPQFHPIPENDLWWGRGFTEWSNVAKAQPNFVGHFQPRVPADLGYYDLRLPEVMEEQAKLAQRYGIHGFCYYYYWFGGKRLLERPIERMLGEGTPKMPFCLCWANENWTRRWDGNDREVLMAQKHSNEDDLAVIRDLMRYFASPHYIRVNGRPLVLIYRVSIFPDFKETARIWREACRAEGIGEIYIAQVESFELVNAGVKPEDYGCDAAVEFPPQGLADPYPLKAELLNPGFEGAVASYRDIAVKYATRPFPDYKRFLGVMPGWDNTARRQHHSYVFEHSTPGAFQAWLETSVARTKQQYCGDERMVFVNAWNEWAEGAYLEPDRRFGHTYLEAVRNALDNQNLMRHDSYVLGK